MTSIFPSSSGLSVRVTSTFAPPGKTRRPRLDRGVTGASLATLSAAQTFLVNLLPSRAADAWFYERRFCGRAENLG